MGRENRSGKRHGSDAAFKSESLDSIATAFMELQLRTSLFINWWNSIPRPISLHTVSILFAQASISHLGQRQLWAEQAKVLTFP